MILKIIMIIFCRFGLFEAMSAIEMMDPKMDAGMMCNQIQRKVLTFDLALEVHLYCSHSYTLSLSTVEMGQRLR